MENEVIERVLLLLFLSFFFKGNRTQVNSTNLGFVFSYLVFQSQKRPKVQKKKKEKKMKAKSWIYLEAQPRPMGEKRKGGSIQASDLVHCCQSAAHLLGPLTYKVTYANTRCDSFFYFFLERRQGSNPKPPHENCPLYHLRSHSQYKV